MVASALALIVEIARYAIARTKANRQQGQSWSDSLADGAKPLTGSIWHDAIIFAALFVGALGAFFYFAPWFVRVAIPCTTPAADGGKAQAGKWLAPHFRLKIVSAPCAPWAPPSSP